MKKLSAILLALVMILSMATTAFAAGGVSLNISHIAGNHEFKAYQIIDGDLVDGIISNPVWGPGVDGDALLAELKADDEKIYAANGVDFVQFSTLFAAATDAKGVLEVLKDFTTNGDRLEHFVKIAAKHVAAAQGTSGAGVLQADETYKYAIDDLDPGYYVVIDVTADANVGSEDYKTRYILALTSHTNLVTKGDFTTGGKGVSETLDGTYKEYIATQLNKTYYFELRAYLDDDLAEFDKYYLQFNDTMSAGMDFIALEEVYVEEVDGDKIYLYKDGAWVADAGAGIAGVPSTYSVTPSASDTKMVLGWEDLKVAYTAVAGDDEVVVKYSAKLNENAIIGEANDNEVTLTFSNGPETDDFGTSVPDYAFVFPFGMRLHKVDADNNEIVLPGAKFVLYHKHGSDTYYANKLDANNKILGWTPYVDEAAMNAAAAAEADPVKKAAILDLGYAYEFVSDASGNFAADGLDENVIYYLHETEAPATYNLMFSDIAFSIHPAYALDGSGVPYVSSISYHVDGVDATVDSGADFDVGRVVVTALNDRGTTLPSTGGIGTTIFYIVGATLVLGAAVLLITKKRMSVEE